MRSEPEVMRHLRHIEALVYAENVDKETLKSLKLEMECLQWCCGSQPPRYVRLVKKVAALVKRVRRRMAAENN